MGDYGAPRKEKAVAEAALFIGWGEVVRGREKNAPTVYNEVMEFWNGLKNDGRIQNFDVAVLGPHARLGGFILARGTEQQIDGVRRSKEFRQVMARTRLHVDDLVIVDAYVDETLAVSRSMLIWREYQPVGILSSNESRLGNDEGVALPKGRRT